jgi:exodeoxyribonuclease-3
MKIVSWNVNGLRSVVKKGFLNWLDVEKPDIICLQEIKAQETDLGWDLKHINDYHSYFNSAEKKGYSGVAVYTLKKPVSTKRKLGHKRFDKEGRMFQLKYPGFTLINIYIPHGGRGKENLDYKLEVYSKLSEKLKQNRSKKLILVGDLNIAHSEIDLSRPSNNKNNIMFTPVERMQIDNILKSGYTDTFRKFNSKKGNYTWWPYFANARQRNLGWRIDYIFTSKLVSGKLQDAFIQKDVKS